MSNLSYQDADMAFKSGAVNPVLAKLYLSHGIRAEAMNDMPSTDRAGLCDDVTYLIETADRATDREMATDILLSLLRHAEKHLKQAIAERLSVLDKAPLRLILQFINDDIDVAQSVLKNSTVLNDLDLLYIILSRDSPFWQAIAQRQNLGENVVETLVDTKDVATAQKLIENTNIIFSDYALGKIAKLANETDLLNDCLINRSQTARGEFARKIYTYAGDALKQLMTDHCGSLSKEVSRKLDEVLMEFTQPTPHHFMPSPSMLKAAELFMEQGKINKTLMLNTLKRGQIASFIAQFSKFTQLPVAVVIAMLQQRSGRGLAIASKANEIDKNEFLMIFNFTRKIMGEDYLSASHVSSALVYYDRITPSVAKRLVKRTTH
jgi:uncharacterized protein (DUF2336 family)